MTSDKTRVLRSGTLVTAEGPQKVLIRDVSRDGATIYASRGVAVNQDVYFNRGSLFVAARIIACHHGEATLRFYRELSPSELDSTVPGLSPQAVPLRQR